MKSRALKQLVPVRAFQELQVPESIFPESDSNMTPQMEGNYMTRPHTMFTSFALIYMILHENSSFLNIDSMGHHCTKWSTPIHPSPFTVSSSLTYVSPLPINLQTHLRPKP